MEGGIWNQAHESISAPRDTAYLQATSPAGTSDAAPFFDRLVAAVRDRNPVLERPQ